jgi:hypothetical protein
MCAFVLGDNLRERRAESISCVRLSNAAFLPSGDSLACEAGFASSLRANFILELDVRENSRAHLHCVDVALAHIF